MNTDPGYEEEIISHNRDVVRAIVVEDMPDVRATIAGILKDRGLQVDLAFDIESAMLLLKEQGYDLAILDLRLNETDLDDTAGLQIAQHVRERNPESLIVILTGLSTYEHMRQAFGTGVDYFLEKSNFDQLDSVINKVALRREAKRESIRQSRLDDVLYELLAMFSHELRSPLLTIKLHAETLVMGALGELTKKQLDAAKSIHSAASRELALLDAHLDFNRIQRGVEKFHYQETNLIDLIRSEVMAHQTAAEVKGVNLRTNLPDQEAIVRLDIGRFRLGLNPLMDNAIRFSPEGEDVYITAELSEQFIELHISDKGSGIKPELIDELLNLRITKADELSQGLRNSGLGLGIAIRFIGLNGGQIWFPRVKYGTTVSIRFPILAKDDRTHVQNSLNRR